ncbi:Rrf2 family transcriptional regulator [Corynebacterium auriscanis]|uniref:Rrf2 family transcriptional regulator n=1 Tax=Corynebacterium auriscanis TaxID=99807 RepID=UPI00224836FC|nr:Rrf2 family transcriptional regulator [Corynebacterium auriscanis]MCX2163219.1 Rrf2 family transcriptional regulator [Corynebacterium auriscanis]
MDTRFAQALHALVYISETPGTASSQALAESIGTNASHVRKLTALLKQSGLVESRQGKAGFALAKPKELITLADVYNAVYPGKKMFHVHQDPNPECPIGQHIQVVLAPIFVGLGDQLVAVLGGQSLAGLIRALYRSASSTTKGNQ